MTKLLAWQTCLSYCKYFQEKNVYNYKMFYILRVYCADISFMTFYSLPLYLYESHKQLSIKIVTVMCYSKLMIFWTKKYQVEARLSVASLK